MLTSHVYVTRPTFLAFGMGNRPLIVTGVLVGRVVYRTVLAQ